jgi:hypothetical protein
MTTKEWATAFLLSLQKAGYKAPVTPNNVSNIQRLIGRESSGNQAGFLRDNNPFNLNTYVAAHGSLAGGKIVSEWGIHVQTFNTVQDGINATVKQFQANPALLAVLNNNGSPALFGGALSTSGWSSGSYANATAFPTTTPFTGSSSYSGAAPDLGNPKGWWGQWAEPVLTGSAVGLKNNPIVPITNDVIVAPVKAAVGAATSVSGLISDITNPTTLKNVGIFVLGLALAGTGLLIFFAQTKTAKGVESGVEKAA